MKRSVSFRFFALRDGAKLTELYAIGTPSLRMDSAGEIKTALSGEFVENSKVNWLTDEIKPVMVLDGVEHPLGIYAVATKKDSETETTKSVKVEAYDRCWRLREYKTETRLYFAASETYQEALEELLTVCGIILYQITPIATPLGIAREWEIGTSYLSIINELLLEINYAQVYFDAEGFAVLRPEPEISVENISKTLDSNNVRSLLLPQIERETDVYNAPNVFIAVCSNADRAAPLVARAENTNPQSPLSILRRGKRIVSVETVNNIADQSTLQEYVDKKRNGSMMSAETVTVSTGLLPGFTAKEVVALRYNDFWGVCKEKSWTMEMKAGGTMSHVLEKVVYNLEQ